MKNEMKTLPSHAVRATRYFYGPSQTKSIVFVGTLPECREFVRDDNRGIYHTAHNESGRWDLRIVTTNSLSPSAKLTARDAQTVDSSHSI